MKSFFRAVTLLCFFACRLSWQFSVFTIPKPADDDPSLFSFACKAIRRSGLTHCMADRDRYVPQ